MPAYNAAPFAPSIAPGDGTQVWAAEAITAGQKSQQVALTRAQGVGRGIVAQGFFSGAPGAFEIDVQGAEVDADAQYVTLPNGAITSTDANDTNSWRYESSGAVPKFVRLLMKALANGVNSTANVSEF